MPHINTFIIHWITITYKRYRFFPFFVNRETWLFAAHRWHAGRHNDLVDVIQSDEECTKAFPVFHFGWPLGGDL